MKIFLNNVPGFRSNNKVKMVIAILYYLMCLICLSGGIGIFLLVLSLPFIVFNLFNLLKSKGRKSFLAVVLSFAIFFVGISVLPHAEDTKLTAKLPKTVQVDGNTVAKSLSKIVSKPVTKPVVRTAPKPVIAANNLGTLKVSYINVGQGDSELIQCDGQDMLIDTGTSASTKYLLSYLSSQHITKIDDLVLTHPHADHIGGASKVIDDYPVTTAYMNKVTTTTKTFKTLVATMLAKNIHPIAPVPGTFFKVGNATCEIISPITSNPKNLNTYSIVIHLVFGNNKFMFTGDAQDSNELDMINAGYDLSSDVLKVGHHGSDTSTSDAFLAKVNPKYAVISCGVDNDYGHPHLSTMQKLQAKKITVYRTDEDGTIECTSNGSSISFDVAQGDYKAGTHKQSNSDN